MNAQNQRLCVWSAAAMIVIMFAGLLVAGFLPLPAPSMTASEVAALISEHTFRIQLGMVLVACGAAFLGPFISAVTVQMRRIEGEHSPLSWLQLGLGTLFVFEFILPCFVCLAATYRPQRSPEVTQALFDLCWLMFVGVVSTAVIQCAAVALAILGDKRAQPIFPRWVGMFNIWTALIFGFGGVIVFFKSGPLAWNGVVTFWIPLSIYGAWLGVMIWAVLGAVARQEREYSELSANDRAPESLDIQHELALLRAEVAAMRAEFSRH
jgi:MFS family permease